MPHSMYESIWAPRHANGRESTEQRNNRQQSAATEQEGPSSTGFVQHSLYESRWTPRARDAVGPNPPTRDEIAAQVSEVQDTPTAHTAEKVIEEPESDQICPICQDTPTDPISTPCAHVFCRDDLARWLQDNSTCPYCRAEVSYEDVFGEKIASRRHGHGRRGNRSTSGPTRYHLDIAEERGFSLTQVLIQGQFWGEGQELTQGQTRARDYLTSVARRMDRYMSEINLIRASVEFLERGNNPVDRGFQEQRIARVQQRIEGHTQELAMFENMTEAELEAHVMQAHNRAVRR